MDLHGVKIPVHEKNRLLLHRGLGLRQPILHDRKYYNFLFIVYKSVLCAPNSKEKEKKDSLYTIYAQMPNGIQISCKNMIEVSHHLY